MHAQMWQLIRQRKKKRMYEKMKEKLENNRKQEKDTRAQIYKYMPLSAREKKEAESKKKVNKSKECSKSGLPR